jgi:hypothetical protein
MTATAPNDSQNPASSGAAGSRIRTVSKASARIRLDDGPLGNQRQHRHRHHQKRALRRHRKPDIRT